MGVPEYTEKDAQALEVEEPVSFARKASVADYKQDAIEAENAEHNMTVLQAVRAYPMASFWAFVMSFTIVRCSLLCRSKD